MTSFPDQPGAAAVVLLREELADDPQNYHQVYMRIKILTDSGKRYADVEIPYSHRNFRIEDVSGRTVHADGTVIPFTGKVFDKEVLKTKESGGRVEQVHVRSFSLPDVQVGSVIEYRYSLRYGDRSFYAPSWEVQDELFQRKATFRFIPYEGLLQLPHDRVGRGVAWTTFLPKGAPGPELHTVPISSTANSRTSSSWVDLAMTNVPPIVHEPYMPPVGALRYRVEFYYMVASKQEEYWKEEGKYWSKDVENFLNKKSGVDAAVAQATAPADPPEEKLKKIYAMVGQLDNWSYQPEREQQEDKALGIKSNVGAEDVLRQHGGRHDDLNRLLVAMARAAGMQAHLMWVSSRDRDFFDPALMSTRQLVAEIAIVNVNGKDLFLDPGTKFCPYGLMAWRYSQVRGLRQSAEGKGTEVAQSSLPDYTKAMVQRLARLQLTPEGRAEGTVKVGFYGLDAMTLRQEGFRTDDAGRKKLLEDEMKRWLPGDSEVTLVQAGDWNQTEPRLAAEFKISSPLAVNSGKRWIVPLHIFQVNRKARFAASQRVNPIYFDYLFRELDEVHIQLPPGMGMESLPPDDKVRTDYAVYSTDQKQEGANGIVSRRDLVLGGLAFPVTEYSGVKTFFDKVKTGDDQPLLLKAGEHAELR